MGLNTNTLYYGDNLNILRRYIPNDSIDLIYLDPPFNSKADYNILFKEPSGEESYAQIQAFSDFWHWDTAARLAYEYLTSNLVENNVSNLAEAFYRLLGKNDMSAYLFIMTERLLELHRVLTPNGSLFLHCDPNASHYLKLVLDAIFCHNNFRNEIIWQKIRIRKAQSGQFSKLHDVIYFYSKSDGYTFHQQFTDLDEKYLKSHFKPDPKSGRYYRLVNFFQGGQGPPRRFGDKVIHPPTGKHWIWSQDRIDQAMREGRIKFTTGGRPCLVRYWDESKGNTVGDIWTDIYPVNAVAEERLGYPTQKPTALLERIIKSCSNEGDWVLDPFCGCGTAIIAAEKLRRHWIGVDITYLAINLVKNRLKDAFPNIRFNVEGEPKDLGAAKELAKDRYQFQWWALSLIGARPVGSTSAKPREGKKGADEGVDGWLRFADGPEGHVERIVVQVKSGHVSVKDIRELRDVVSRQKTAMGLYITLEEPTSEMIKEVKATDPYFSPRYNQEFPKIQILTIEELLKGIRPYIPLTMSPYKEANNEERIRNIKNATLD